MSNFDNNNNNTIDYNNLDWGAPLYSVETISFGVEIHFTEDHQFCAIWHSEGQPIEVHAVCPPIEAGEAVVYENGDPHYQVLAFAHLHKAGPVLKIKAPLGVFFLAHSRGEALTYKL